MDESIRNYLVWLVILLGCLVVINLTIGTYGYKGIEIKGQAHLDQCKIMIDNLEDKLPDLINYERTNTDSLQIISSYSLEKCKANLSNTDYYFQGKHLEFWAIWIFLNGLIFVILGIIIPMAVRDIVYI